jgi:hypothetical protein
MNRLLAHDAKHVAMASEEPRPLPDEHLGIPPPDPTHVQVALVIDVVHDQPDLIDVTGQHDHRRPAGIDRGQTVPRHVAPHVGERMGVIAPDPRRPTLESRGPRRIQQTLEKRDRSR